MKIKWCTVTVSNLKQSTEFYRDLLGLKVERSFSPFPGTEITFLVDQDGRELELLCSGKSVAAGNVSIGIESDKYDEILNKARDNEILLSQPAVLGGMECFFITDPDGVNIQVIKAK